MSSNAPQYLNETAVKEVLTWPMVNEAVEEAFKAVSAPSKGEQENELYASQPERSITIAGEGVLLTMPAYMANYKLTNKGTRTTPLKTLACKVVSSFQSNESLVPPLPAILANILLFNIQTGKLECIMEGTQITAWRTAAASIVSTKYLYFKRLALNINTPIKLAIIGCGVQGRSHALDMCATFNVKQVHLWNRTISKADALAHDLHAKYSSNTEIRVADSPATAVANADIICVGTSSAQALINYGMLPQKAIHINTVGAGKVHFGEIADDIYACGTVFVDSWANAKKELKHLKAAISAEVGETINGNKNFTGTKNITIFQSMGMAAEDAAVAQAVYEALDK